MFSKKQGEEILKASYSRFCRVYEQKYRYHPEKFREIPNFMIWKNASDHEIWSRCRVNKHEPYNKAYPIDTRPVKKVKTNRIFLVSNISEYDVEKCGDDSLLRLKNERKVPYIKTPFRESETLVLHSKNTQEKKEITIEIDQAKEPVEIFQGCSYHIGFNKNQGLLYVLDVSVQKLTWRNQNFDTDLIFFDENGICKKLIPNSNRNQSSKNFIQWSHPYVLELAAGFIKSNNLNEQVSINPKNIYNY